MSEARDGWLYSRLSNVAEIGTGVTLGRELGTISSVDLPYLRVANVQDGRIDTSDVKRVRILPLELPRYRLQKGDILLTEGGDFDKLGRGAVWDGSIPDCLHQNHIFRVRVRDGIVPEFFAAYMASAEGRNYFLSCAKQTTNLASINKSQLSAMLVPVPPVSEQRLIAEVLDAVDRQIESDGTLIGKAELLHSAVVHDALRRAMIACRYLTVGSFFQIKSGITLGPLREPRAHACRYLRVANVHRGAIDLADIAELEASPSEQAELRLRSGDLLVVEGHANPNEIGRCALVGEDAAGLLYQNHLFRLRSDVVEPEFGELWLNSSAARAYWRRMCATSSGLYTINSRMLRDLPFPDLTLDAQMEVVNAQQAVAGKIKTQQAELAKLRTLKQGLMDDLLTGRVRVGGTPLGLACLDARGERAPGLGGEGQRYAVMVGRVAD